jgi:hypothetical protein
MLSVWPLLLVFIAGCNTGDSGIRSYEVPALPDVATAPNQPSKDAGTQTEQAPQQLLAAIVPAGDAMWFAKLTGDKAVVDKLGDTFEKFVASMKIQEGEPQWTLPSDWTQKPGDSFRYATLIAPVESGGVEIAISKLGYAGQTADDFAAYVRDNVNRWRGQMQVEAVDSTTVADHARTLESAENGALLVLIEGTAPATMSPAFASGPAAAAAEGSVPTGGRSIAAPLPGAVAAATSAFRSKLPDGWERSATRPMVMAVYSTADPDAEVAITRFPIVAEMADKLSNLNRWRGQVGLAPVDASDVATAFRDIEIDGQPASLVELLPDEGAPLAMVVAMLERDNNVWFFKLSGKPSAVASQQSAMREWLATIEFDTQAAE